MRAWILLAVLAGTAAADAPVAGPPVAGKRAPTTSTPNGDVAIVGRQSYDQTSLGADAVATKLNMVYLSGITRCYRELLKASPDARGNGTLQLTVSANGHTGKIELTAFTNRLDDCVTKLAGSWTFPIPKDKADKPTAARFMLVLGFE